MGPAHLEVRIAMKTKTKVKAGRDYYQEFGVAPMIR